ncbi:MAG: hypothetical protein Q8M07_06600, partial [Prosthecobacter sp.]|nr:hypothetical protein [Prosthecobacter sp.]
MERSAASGIQSLASCGLVWQNAVMTKAHDEIIDFIAAGPSSKAVMSFAASAEIKQRVESLISKKKRDGLLPEEEEELADYVQLEKL